MGKRILEEMTEWIESHKEELIEDIKGLMEIPSVAAEPEGEYPYGKPCSDAVRYVGKLAERYGFVWKNHDWHCISVSYGTGEKQLGIWGHLDVVDAGDINEWLYEPYHCTRNGDFLIGRGSQDNKGPCVASLYLLRYLKENGIVPDFEIRLVFGCQEEAGMKDVEEYLKREKAPDISMVCDCGFPVCFAEKGSFKITLRSKRLSEAVTDAGGGEAPNTVPERGYAVIHGRTYETEGLAGPAAEPDGTRNALGLLGECCLRDQGLGAEDREAFQFLHMAGMDGYGTALGVGCMDDISGKMTCSPVLLEVKDRHMEVTMHIRYPVTADRDEVYGDLERAAASYGFTILAAEGLNSAYMNPESEWVSFLSRKFEEVTGRAEQPFCMAAGTYARKIPNAVGFGPGLPMDLTVIDMPKGHGACHVPDETQSINNLLTAWKIYTSSAVELIEKGL